MGQVVSDIHHLTYYLNQFDKDMIKATIHSNYRDIEHLRQNFFDFIPKVYKGLSFKKWYELGFWNDRYIPFSMFYQGKIISNVSVYEIKIIIKDEIKKAVQLATIGTLPEYRNYGLATKLIINIMKKYERDTSLFFLFANNDVLNFYPKFGFRPINEWIFSSDISLKKQNLNARKLDMNKLEDQELLQNLLRTRLPITTKFGATDYSHIFLWHSVYFWKDFLWYIAEKNIIIVGYIHKNSMHIYDIVHNTPFSAKEIMPCIAMQQINKIFFYFTPELLDISTKPEKIYTDSPLFVKGYFPLDKVYFKFPITGQA